MNSVVDNEYKELLVSELKTVDSISFYIYFTFIFLILNLELVRKMKTL